MQHNTQAYLILSTFFLLFSTTYTASISNIIAGNEALTQISLAADEFLVALTPQSGFSAARVSTPSTPSRNIPLIHPHAYA